MTMTEHVNNTPVDDITAWLTTGSRPQATIDVCIAGDLWDAHSALVDEAVAEGQRLATINAKPAGAQTMPDRAEVRRISEHIDALRDQQDELHDQVAAASRPFVLRAIDPTLFRRMNIAHPPRDDDPDDKRWGVNVDTFFRQLVRACTVSPELSNEQWAQLLGGTVKVEDDDGNEVERTYESKLSSKQWDDLWGTAFSLNRRELAIPKSQRPSGETAGSDAE
jgi:hypothetical protein